jgi:hypothetical protein
MGRDQHLLHSRRGREVVEHARSIAAGTTTFTRTLRLAYWSATDFVSPTTACSLAVWTCSTPLPRV